MIVSILKEKLDALANAIGIKAKKRVPQTIDELVETVESIEVANLQSSKIVTPDIQDQTVTPDAGYNGFSSVLVKAPKLQSLSATKTSTGATIYTPSSPAIGFSTVSITTPSANITRALSYGYTTVSGARKWQVRPYTYNGRAGIEAFGYVYGSYNTFNAIPTGTTITPSTSSQTIGGANYMMEGAVTVAAMPSGSATTPDTTITANPLITRTLGGLITATASASKAITPTVSAGYVSSGTAGTVSVSGSTTMQLDTQSGATITPTESEQTAVARGKYTTGDVKVAAIPSQYIIPAGNKEITENGTNIDVTDYATVSVAVPSSGGGIYQDENGYLVLSEDGGGSSVQVEALSVTQNGTYTAPSGKAYSPVTVNVGGVEPTPWERPSDWPDLSKMDVSGDDILYMTSYADEARGFCSFRITCTGNYTVEVGHISGTTYVTESSQSFASTVFCNLYYGSSNGTYKVLRVTGTDITRLGFQNGATVNIGNFNGYTCNQGIVDVVGKLSSCTGISCYRQFNLVNMAIDGVALSGSQVNAFADCASLTSLDVSGWDTSAVTSMGSMFSGCCSLTSLDVSGWDTSAVTSMTSMFQSCNSLISLDASEWDTSAVTSMANMFYSCNSLTSLDVSGWDTSAVTSMATMFYICFSLKSLDVSGWDTSAVTNMGSMFYNCYSLTSLDVSEWDTSAATSMANMFSSCASLTSLDVSGWDTSAATNMNSMFSGCYSLTSLDVSGWDTSAATNMNYTFASCNSLTSLDVSEWDTSAVTSMNSMFTSCNSLTSLDVSGWDTSAVTVMASMFNNCYSLMSLDVSEWDTSAATNMSSMFYNCYSLMSLDVSGWDFSAITSGSGTSSMFYNCYGLKKSLTLPSSMAFLGASCFGNCRSLEEWHFLATTPPSLANSSNVFTSMTDFGGKKIYVPAASLSAYQSASMWAAYAGYMVGE